MCQNPTTTTSTNPEPEPEVLTREKLHSLLIDLKNTAINQYVSAPWLSQHERDAVQMREAIDEVLSKVATMKFPPTEPAKAPAIEQKISDLSESDVDFVLQPLRKGKDIGQLSAAILYLYMYTPQGSRLHHVLDVISDAALELEGKDEEDDDAEDRISEELKDKVLNRLEDLAENASPSVHAERLLDALAELYDEAVFGSTLETMAEGLMNAAQALVEALDKEEQGGTMVIELLLNGVKIPLKRVE